MKQPTLINYIARYREATRFLAKADTVKKSKLCQRKADEAKSKIIDIVTSDDFYDHYSSDMYSRYLHF